MLGTFAGKIMKEGKENRKGVVRLLLLLGIVLIGVSLLWSLQMPIIKRLWTCFPEDSAFCLWDYFIIG